jgi:DNA-binding NarL/FixJ family response regulator/anti-sigma regulatory factor (Ser/Thr protein kinase)
MGIDVKKVLLVEDDRQQAALLQEGLLRACPGQFELTWADSLKKAVNLMKSESFDAVLLDLSLPDSQGMTTIERATAAFGTTPIVALTGLTDEQVAVQAVRKGAQDYLIKGETDSRSIARAIRYAIDRKRIEEDLRGARDHLDAKVRQRTAELLQTVDTLREEVDRRILAEQVLQDRSSQLRLLASELTLAEQRERQRLAQVLHDGLQQLLVGARFRLGLLERSSQREVRQTATEVADLIAESIESSRLLTAELSPPILHEGGLLPAMEWLVRWMQERHGLIVDLKGHARVEQAADSVTILLFQATRELLFNVVKHAGVKSASVEVTRQDGHIRIEVADKGAGFDPSLLRTEGGTAGGFGLFSIRERLDLLGGQMEIDSAPGRGSRFTLTAPLAPPLEGVAAPPDRRPKVSVGVATPHAASAAGAEGRIRVMLVDDHVVMRQGLARLLREEGDMDIVGEASDGIAAVDLVRQVRPDVVLMDVGMPGMNGIEATRIIRAEAPEVRVIGLSMFKESDRAAAMLQAGAVEYLTKSGQADEMIAAIRRVGAMAAAPTVQPPETPSAAEDPPGKRRRPGKRG